MAIVIDHVVEIDASPETVWSVLTDFANYELWNPLAVQCTTSLVPGEPIDMMVQLKPGPLRKQREFVRSHTPGVEFSYTMKPVGGGHVLRSQRAQRIEAIEGGRTRYTAHFEIRGALSSLVAALLGKDLQRGFDGVAAGLKSRAESL